MRRVLVALIFVAVSAAGAQAQQRWSGFYLGLNGGYGWTDLETTDSFLSTAGSVFGIAPTVTATYPSADSKSSFGGVFAGLQAGYNWQMGNIVAGVETDFQLASMDRSDQALGSIAGPVYVTSASVDYFGTLRGKLGYATKDFLIYGTGGLAYGQGTGTISITPGTVPVAGGVYNGKDSQTHVGFAYGGGFEIALSKTISLKAEYLHIDLGKEGYTFDLGAPDNSFVKADEALVIDIVRAGVNVKF